MPRVSVVIPAFNAAALIGTTLASVLEGTYQDLELVVIDDGSADETAAVAAAYGAKVRVVSQANAGMSAARNVGIAQSHGQFIALLDADDVWHPQKLALQVAAMDAEPDVGVCYTEFFAWDGVGVARFGLPASAEQAPDLTGWIYHWMLLTNFVLPSSALIRRDVFERSGPFTCACQQTDDWEFFVRVSREWQFLKLAAPLVAYRQTPGSLSRRIMATNEPEAMRDSLIDRFGLVSPQGFEVDRAELSRRRHKGRMDFANAHLARGSLIRGIVSSVRLIADGPARFSTSLALMNAVRRRFFPKRGTQLTG